MEDFEAPVGKNCAFRKLQVDERQKDRHEPCCRGPGTPGWVYIGSGGATGWEQHVCYLYDGKRSLAALCRVG